LLALSERAVNICSELLDLVQIRRSADKDSDLDAVDVRVQVEAAQSEVERVREAYGEVRRALNVVLGRYLAAELEIAANYPALPPLAATGVRARVEIATEQQVQAVARYGAIAPTAFREVENSLANERFLALQLRQLERLTRLPVIYD